MFLEISYSKLNSAAWISHRDMIQYFSRLFRRAKIKIDYSKGFSPRPVIVFSLAHSVGVEGENEILIVKLKENEDIDLKASLERLKEKTVSDINIKSLCFCETKKKFFSSLSTITYKFKFDNKFSDENEFIKISKMPEVIITKGKMKKEKNIAKEILKTYKLEDNFFIDVLYQQNGVITHKNLKEVIENLFKINSDDIFCARIIKKKSL